MNAVGSVLDVFLGTLLQPVKRRCNNKCGKIGGIDQLCVSLKTSETLDLARISLSHSHSAGVRANT